jgi:hypothetical protein
LLADHPIGYWRLGDAAGNAADTSGRGNTGTYRSGVMQGVPGAIVGDPDTAAQFTGQTGAIVVGSGFNFPGTAAFSIEAWIKPTIIDGNFRHVFTKQHRDTPKEGYALLVQQDNGISFERFIDDNIAMAKVATMPPSASFTHVVATYDGALMRLYVNGQLAGQSVEGGRPAAAVLVEPALIGAAALDESIFFAGAIDEVAVYAAPLPAIRIQAHYQTGTAP